MQLERLTYLVHGFNAKDGDKSVNKLTKFLKSDFESDYVKWTYGWFGLFSVIFRNKSIAKKIAKDINAAKRKHGSEISCIGHSNGCAILAETAKSATIDKLILFNPALKVDTVFDPSIKEIYIFHTKHDVPTRAAAFLDKVPGIQLIIPNAWGKMGAFGSNVKDSRIINVDMSHDVYFHSSAFNIDEYGDMVHDIIYNV